MSKSQLLKNKLIEFYKDDDIYQKFLDVKDKQTRYSLRVIEWFCSNYSKKYNIIYKVKGIDFNVFLSYKNQLDSYQKKQFDPFKRKHTNFEIFKITRKTGRYKDTVVETTVGQLNFFKWCITNKIFDYIDKNLTDIKNDMNKTIKSKNLIEQKSIGPIQEISNSTSRVFVKRYSNFVLDLN